MKFSARYLILILAVFVIYFVYSGVLQGRSGSFFKPVSNDLDSQVDSLRQQLGYVQSKLGMTSYDFDFAIPEGKKLVATFVANMDDKPVPQLSGVFHIPTTDEAPDKKGHLSVVFFHPKYESLSEQSSTCDISFRVPKANVNYTMPLPFDRISFAGGVSMSNGASALPSLDEGKDHPAWNIMIMAEGRDKSGQPSYVFKYTLNVRLEKLAEGEILNEIKRDELPASQ